MQQNRVHLQLKTVLVVMDQNGQLQHQNFLKTEEIAVDVVAAGTTRRRKKVIGSAGGTVAAAEMLG